MTTKKHDDQWLTAEITLPFEDPAALMRVLTPGRRRVIEIAREEPLSVSELARRLKRDIRAVSRDVDLLEKHKVVLNTGYDKQPGQGFRRIVRPAAAKIRLETTV